MQNLNRSVLLLLCLVLVTPAFSQDKIRIAVMDLKARSGIDNMTVLSLTDLMCTEIAGFGNYTVIGRDDMQSMMEHIADKQLLDCDDTQCLAQLGGALGAKELLSGNIGKIGETYLINLKRIDIEYAEVLNRVSEEFSGDESGLIGSVKNSVYRLFGKEELVKEVKIAKKKELAAKSFPTQRAGSGALKFTSLGAAVAAGGASAFFYNKGNSIYDNEYTFAENTPDADNAHKQVQTMDMLRNISLGVTSALSAFTIYLFFK